MKAWGEVNTAAQANEALLKCKQTNSNIDSHLANFNRMLARCADPPLGPFICSIFINSLLPAEAKFLAYNTTLSHGVKYQWSNLDSLQEFAAEVLPCPPSLKGGLAVHKVSVDGGERKMTGDEAQKKGLCRYCKKDKDGCPAAGREDVEGCVEFAGRNRKAGGEGQEALNV